MTKTREIECPGCGQRFTTISRSADTFCLQNADCRAAYDATVDQVEKRRAQVRSTRQARRRRRQPQPAFGDYGQLGAFLGAYRHTDPADQAQDDA